MTRAVLVATVGFGTGMFATTAAVAQESTNRVATMTDWSVFVEENPKECWGVSSPKESVNTRDGQPVQVRRGEVLLFVTFRSGVAGEISFSGGYPFAGGSTVRMDVDGTRYELITDGEWAWPGTKEDDAAILAALKKGTTAVLTARSGRGTQTVDTFSLRGFTASMEEAGKRCS
ncbi:invasion associated locus B family protein [Tabrizicola sp.]|uniref:invasion associated locus B family protein n=1 Tax=Tabrizicola sp. TaxID=2005166 RepID=UPI003D2D993C